MILVTGGAGFIGAHTCVELLGAGMGCVIFDNFSNSTPDVPERIRRITGQHVPCEEGDVRDGAALARVLARYPIRAVIHFAGLKAVGESVAQPLRYFEHNVGGTLALLHAMRAAGVHTLVFSSSATVYQESAEQPLHEDCALAASSPYGRSKWWVEQMLADLAASEPSQWRIACLRYFNPVGAHESALIGEAPRGTPNNLMPYIAQVAAGLRPHLQVFGGDWPTPDGTGRRDYIHVCDLALGHVAALRHLHAQPGCITLNLGTGRPTSVLEMIAAFERASGRSVPWQIAPRRAGDVAQCWANPARAEKTLGWRAMHDVPRMCRDAWRWQSRQADLA